MKDFEIPKYERAKKELPAAFWEGYEDGLHRLADGEPQEDTDEAWPIGVSRSNVLDGEIGGWIVFFREEGRRAALAKRRRGKPKLHEDDSDPDGFRMRNEFRWFVELNPASPAE